MLLFDCWEILLQNKLATKILVKMGVIEFAIKKNPSAALY
jgi:hypothetical protein